MASPATHPDPAHHIQKRRTGLGALAQEALSPALVVLPASRLWEGEPGISLHETSKKNWIRRGTERREKRERVKGGTQGVWDVERKGREGKGRAYGGGM